MRERFPYKRLRARWSALQSENEDQQTFCGERADCARKPQDTAEYLAARGGREAIKRHIEGFRKVKCVKVKYTHTYIIHKNRIGGCAVSRQQIKIYGFAH